MASYEYGKVALVKALKQAYNKGDTCLDVGACDGIWYYLLGDYFKMDGIEIFEPYIEENKLDTLYEHLFQLDARYFRYKHYDLIIFGDVLEHMSAEDASNVLNYAVPRCNDFLVALPFELPQEAINGNPNEVHIQDDLTPEIVAERYPMLTPLFVYPQYGYYHKNPNYMI